MVAVNNSSTVSERTLMWAIVNNGTLTINASGTYGNFSYANGVLTVTGTYSGLTYYMYVFGDYTIQS